MTLRALTQRTFHRHLYAGILKTVTLLKREDDQKQGTVRSVLLFEARRSFMTKQGQTIQAEMSSQHSTTWHLWRSELDRVGVNYINALDRIVEDTDDAGNKLTIPRVWQPESGTSIDVKLFEVEVHINCLRVDEPPPGS